MRDLPSQETDGNRTNTEESDKNTSFLRTQEIAETPSQRTVTIVCVTRPQKLLDLLHREFGFAATSEPGVYCNNDTRLPVWIIHPTELVLEPVNYPLLPLARGKKLEQFVELCATEGLVEYLQLTLDIGILVDPDAIWQKIMELVNMEITVREETWPYIDEFFRKVPEALQKLPTLKEAFEEHARKAAAEAAGKVLEKAEKAAEEGELRGELRGERRGELKSQQHTLLLILDHQFGEVPPEITDLVENTVDLSRLRQWLEEALDASSLAQISFFSNK